MPSPPAALTTLLAQLAASRVEFILVGGLAAVAQGAPLLAPQRSALLGAGHNLLITDLGPLAVLGAIEGGRGYVELLPHSVEIEIARRPIRVLSLEMLVEPKRGATTPKDRLSLGHPRRDAPSARLICARI